ncbi:hypothetical protein HPP92_013263 [Vanilla planifolia]|uniref:Uncharacterized protein n=1 Tax=Vanilla planifolia TaxID=51239 RepID=A0A835UWA8_VANPL|nr:hypothetical protein HPP92_013263 [Vanilla planifolia]
MVLLLNTAGQAGVVAAATSLPGLLPRSSFSPSLFLFIRLLPSYRRRRSSHILLAGKGFSSRTRRLEKRRKKGGASTYEVEEDSLGLDKREAENGGSSFDFVGTLEGVRETVYSTGPKPVLPGEQPDFWEGERWNLFGFFVQYMWAFGIVFGLIACGISVATYNEGASDLKETSAYKESIQSRELLEQPDASSSNVFEVNPTEVAPSLE